MNIIDFDTAIEASATYPKRHLLLGNGFSISCRPDIFVYKRLLENSNLSQLSEAARKSFDTLGTTDFERVIKTLSEAARLGACYGVEPATIQRMQDDSETLKELLVQTIAESHPERPTDISDAEYCACHAFLKHFSTTYTLNYDLLLYWTRMHQQSVAAITSDDGFRTSELDATSGHDSDYVVWESGQAHDQNMWFLHGALHVFDSGTEIRKFTWTRTGIRLIEQVRAALKTGLFPLFVAEGSSEEKLYRIRHSDYLAKAYRSFQEIQHCLFIHGHSLSQSDEHYLRLIERGKISKLYVSLHGDQSSSNNKRIIRRAELMKSNRGSKRPLEIGFYNSDSACVWGHLTTTSEGNGRIT